MADRGPVPPVVRPLALACEPVYRAVVARRNRAFDAGERVSRAQIPVISIGNLSVGGTGKTPMVMHTVKLLREMWRKPGIAMRGYKATPGKLSDEQAEYAERLPGVPVVANPDRVAGVRELRTAHGADCAVLDDGFQHRFIARDLDIVLIDATRSPFEDRCLPAGWLREPVTSLRRADAVVVTRSDRVSEARLNELRTRLEELCGHPPVAIAAHAWENLVDGMDGQIRSTEALSGARVVVASAIGNPDAFVKQVNSTGADVRRSVVRRDHHAWTSADAAGLVDALQENAAEALITTHKDWVKLREHLTPEMLGERRVLFPRVGIRMVEGGLAYADLLKGAIGPAAAPENASEPPSI